MLRAVLLSLMGLVAACSPGPPPTTPGAESCGFFGGRGYSLTVRAQGSHALQFRELGYDDATGVVRVHDSDLFATGVEAKEPRVIVRAITLGEAERSRLSHDLTARCPSGDELAAEGVSGGGGTRLEVRTASGALGTARFVPGAGADVARSALRRLSRYFPELRAQ